MWAAIGSLLAIVATILTWWLGGSNMRARKRVWNEIKREEARLAEALAKHDSDAATLATERLRALREELRRLSAGK